MDRFQVQRGYAKYQQAREFPLGATYDVSTLKAPRMARVVIGKSRLIWDSWLIKAVVYVLVKVLRILIYSGCQGYKSGWYVWKLWCVCGQGG